LTAAGAAGSGGAIVGCGVQRRRRLRRDNIRGPIDAVDAAATPPGLSNRRDCLSEFTVYDLFRRHQRAFREPAGLTVFLTNVISYGVRVKRSFSFLVSSGRWKAPDSNVNNVYHNITQAFSLLSCPNISDLHFHGWNRVKTKSQAIHNISSPFRVFLLLFRINM
jgi:hypothetical protein